MTKYILLGLIIIATAIFTFVSFDFQMYRVAAVAFVSGVVWLLLQIRDKESLESIFLVLFTGLAIMGSLREMSVPLVLFGLTVTLAAWDLSRLQARIRDISVQEAKTRLEKNHLQKLSIIAFVGFLTALIPLYIQFSINFVAFVFILLLVMLIFRQAVIYLRTENIDAIDAIDS